MDGFIAKLRFALFFFRASTQGVIFVRASEAITVPVWNFPGILKQFQEVREYTQKEQAKTSTSFCKL